MIRQIAIVLGFLGLCVLGGVLSLLPGHFFMLAEEVSPLIITALYPNTYNDPNDEYIIITNVSCETISLSGMSVTDLTNKPYTFASGVIAPGESLQIMQPIFRFGLNNDKETVTLSSASGQIYSSRSYTKTTKGQIISYAWDVPDCRTEGGDGGASSDTGSTQTGVSSSGEVFASGGEEGSLSGSQDGSGAVLTGAQNPSETSSGASSLSGGLSSEEVVAGSGVMTSSGTGSGDLDTSSGSSGSGGVLGTQEAYSGSGESLSSSGITATASGSETLSGALGSGSSVSGSLVSSGVTTVDTQTQSSSPSSVSVGGGGGTPSVSQTGTSSSAALDPLSPEILLVYDRDQDGLYDEVRLRYASTLTGVVSRSSLKIYSATGGVYSDRLYEGYDIIEGILIEGSDLVLLLDRGSASLGLGDSWRINKTTSSHLRISGKLPSITTLGGGGLRDLTYTVMLDGYQSSRITLGPLPHASSATLDSGSGQVSSGSVTQADPLSVDLSTWQLQSPSNVTLSSGSISCPHESCRINPIATTPKGATCQWLLDDLILSESCNPPTLYPLAHDKNLSISIKDSSGKSLLYEKYALTHLPPSPPKTSQPIQSNCTPENTPLSVEIIGVNPSPRLRTDEYILLKNTSHLSNASLCGCHITRVTESKGQVTEKDSRDLQAIISPNGQYTLSTSESKLSLPKTSAQLDLVCQGVVIDTFRYAGNHTDDLLLTEVILDHEWYQGLARLRADISDAIALPGLSDLSARVSRTISNSLQDSLIEQTDRDISSLLMTESRITPPEIIWSIGAGEEDEIFFADDDALVCETPTDSCQLRGQVIGLVSPGVYRITLRQSGSIVMTSDWYTPKKDIKLDLLAGEYDIELAWIHRDIKRRASAPTIHSQVRIISHERIHQTPPRVKKLPKAKKSSTTKQKSTPREPVSVPAFAPSSLASQIGLLSFLASLGVIGLLVRRSIVRI